jgi:hypothetical protein
MCNQPSKPVPCIPPLGLREIESSCVVCSSALPDPLERHPLRLQLSQDNAALPLLTIAYACKPCRFTRHDEVTKAHFEAASRYIHLPKQNSPN